MSCERITDPRLSVAILTVSDTCSKDILLDQSGPVAESLLQEAGFAVPLRDCVPDDRDIIRCVLMRWISSRQVDAVFTLGGTGPSRKDVTSDIILEIVPQNQRLPGIEHYLYSISLQNTPMGALSRFVAGVCNATLLITLPGSARAASQCIPVILPIVKHAIHQIKGWDHLVKQKHPNQYNMDKSILTSADPSTTTYSVVNRCRQSNYPMISVDEAIKKIFTVCNFELGIEAVFHKNALGRVLGQSLKSRQCIPPFNASIMDGYAIRFNDGASQLKVIGVLYCGDDKCSARELVVVTPGTCVRVNTGGPIPSGADCVIPLENTKLISKRKAGPMDLYSEEEDIIEVIIPPKTIGQFIRPTGIDLSTKDIFRRGLRLGSTELGLISGAGLLAPWPINHLDCIKVDNDPIPNTVLDLLSKGGYLPCLKQCNIAVLSTGNEILDCVCVSEMKPIVRDSNRPVLINLLYKHNYYNVIDCGILNDDRKSLILGLSRALTLCDILITTGGVSMGERDMVSQILIEHFNATVHFGRVFMKPGKPTTFLSIPRHNNNNINNNPDVTNTTYTNDISSIRMDVKEEEVSRSEEENGKQKEQKPLTTTTTTTTTTNLKPVLAFCLPGNPVSCYVTAHLFVLPLLRKLDLRPPEEWCFPNIRVQLLHSVRLSDRPDYRRAKLIWKNTSNYPNQPSIPCASCTSIENQMSSCLASCLDANLLLVLPPMIDEKPQEIPANSIVNALIIDSIF
ncbi:unnamed protein product [Schistosoma turkestanicum]|nr:unnamed protein product [Schistosoma turkestanicum]